MESWMIPAAGSMLILLACALLGWTLHRRRRSRSPKNPFGPEYDAFLLQTGRRSRVRPLSEQEFDRFLATWRGIQTLFMESPIGAVAEAELFVKEVMHTRGYPVDHPDVVSQYGAARAIALKSRAGPVSTEELRQAMVHYRALVESLLESSENLVTEPVPTH